MNSSQSICIIMEIRGGIVLYKILAELTKRFVEIIAGTVNKSLCLSRAWDRFDGIICEQVSEINY